MKELLVVIPVLNERDNIEPPAAAVNRGLAGMLLVADKLTGRWRSTGRRLRQRWRR